VPAGAVAAYLELHIEQGARLEEAGIPIGIVEQIVGVRRSRVIFLGQARPRRHHADGSPARRVPGLGRLRAARARARRRARQQAQRDQFRCGSRAIPARPTSSPPAPELVHEMRDPDVAVLERLAAECATLARDVAGAHKVGLEIQPMSATTPAPCSPRVQAVTEKVCANLGSRPVVCTRRPATTPRTWPRITDSGMIFIPSHGREQPSCRRDERLAGDRARRERAPAHATGSRKRPPPDGGARRGCRVTSPMAP